MKLYFDTNVYDFISDKREDSLIADLVKSNKLEIEASSTNLMEIYSIPNRELCKRQLNTLVAVATSFEKKPESWWQAKEILSEIKRVNPHWLRQQPSEKLLTQEKFYLRNHLYKWEKACDLFIPQKSDIAQYRRDFERGISDLIQTQKLFRQRLLKNNLDLSLFTSRNGRIIDLLDGNFLEPDLFWRVDCLSVWFEAISRKRPESRDYADWLLPYVREKAFDNPTYIEFWINRVKAEKVCKNRITALVSFYQLKHKVTHGNSNDQLHACHIFDADVFLTADRAFFQILEQILPHFTKTARIVLIDRQASSALDEITKELG